MYASYALPTTCAPLRFSPLYSLSFSPTILSVIQRSSAGFVLLTEKHLNFCPRVISDISLLRLFPFPDLSLSTAFSRNACFGRLSINRIEPALIFPLEELHSRCTYVIIYRTLPNVLPGKCREGLISVCIFHFHREDVGSLMKTSAACERCLLLS